MECLPLQPSSAPTFCAGELGGGGEWDGDQGKCVCVSACFVGGGLGGGEEEEIKDQYFRTCRHRLQRLNERRDF